MKQDRNIRSYAAIFEPAIEGGYNVSFPDFPGCVTFGNTLKTAKKNAVEVLELWLEELAEQHKHIPSKSILPIVTRISVAIPPIQHR